MYKVFILIIIVFAAISCHTTEPEKQKLEITVEDASCTEAWLNVKGETGSEIILNRDGKEVQRFTLSISPQTVYDDSLLPNKSYDYQLIKNGEASSKTTVTTLDTTSHNFTWQKYTFGGDAGSSSFSDVAIIDENDIWAVGEIYVSDNSALGYTFYNAVHWNGNVWELKKIPVRDFGTLVGIFPLRAVFAFAQNNIWFASYADLIKWDGEKFESKAFFMESTPFNGQVNKIWGSSENNLYCVGNGGAIYIYNGQNWHRIETGTTLPIRDIWGDFNDKTSNYEILAVAAEVDVNKGSKILRINDNTVTEESNNGLSWDVGGLWFKSGRKYYVAGAGIHYKHALNDSLWNRYKQGVVTYYLGYGIRGSNINNVFAAGSFLEIAHFNGMTWHNYRNVISSDYGALNNMAIKGDLVVMTGSDGAKALLITGKRN